MTTWVIHHNDLDGKCAAAIVAHFDKDVEFWEVDYKDQMIFEGKVRVGDSVVIVDFSLKPEAMKSLIEIVGHHHVVWIDHHKTAREYEHDYDYYLSGLRNFEDKAFSGCELTWFYYFGSAPMPKAVELIGDYDKWAHRLYPDSTLFCEGLMLRDTHPTKNNSLWRCLWEAGNNDSTLVGDIISDGKTCLLYKKAYCSSICKNYGFEIMVEGHKAYCLNLSNMGSFAFGSKLDEYPICVSYIFDGTAFRFSLYSVSVDVSEICKKFGGGGHKGAAGFVLTSFPFHDNHENT